MKKPPMKRSKTQSLIYIGADHGGLEVKEKLKIALQEDYEVIDCGAFSLDPDDDFVDFAVKVAKEVANNPGTLGVLICKSGNGMVIAANKIKGAYASLCINPAHALMARRDDNANIICLAAEYQSNFVETTRAFLESEFASAEERFIRRFRKVRELEANMDDDL